MAEKMVMLALSPTMEKGRIVKWKKQEGDKIVAGEVVAEVETDKAVMDYTSMQEGTLLKIVVPEGGEAEVEETIGILGEEGEKIDEEMLMRPVEHEKAETGEQETKEAEKEEKEETTKPEEKVLSSPMARTKAKAAGIDICRLKGSGPKGRVVAADVDKAIQDGQGRKAEEGETKDEVLEASGLRIAIAKLMVESKFSAPHYYLKVSVRMDTIIEARRYYNEHWGKDDKISLNAYLMKFAAQTIRRHPMINSTWSDGKILRHGSVDMGLAVAVEEGLRAPVVRNCTVKGVRAIDAEIKALVAKAKENRLGAEDHQNATFTITNLGSMGIEEFTAIINPPGSAILAVGEIRRMPVVNDRDEVEIHSVAKLTLSCDHRLIDGAVGAAFLHDLKVMMEHPIHEMY